jgi:hypothetical protein
MKVPLQSTLPTGAKKCIKSFKTKEKSEKSPEKYKMTKNPPKSEESSSGLYEYRRRLLRKRG